MLPLIQRFAEEDAVCPLCQSAYPLLLRPDMVTGRLNGIWQKKESILEQAEKKMNELAKLEESRRQQSAAYTNTLIGLVMNTQDTSQSGQLVQSGRVGRLS